MEVFEKAQEGMRLFGASGRIFLVNGAYAGLIGYAKEELMNDAFDWGTIVAPEDRELVKRNAEEVLKTGEPGHYEAKFVKKDGSLAYVMVSESRLGVTREGWPETIMLETVYDITELKESKAKLEEAAANQQKAIEGATAEVEQERRYWQDLFVAFSQSGMAVFDPEGKVWNVNEKTSKMFGYTKEEVLEPGFSWANIIAPKDLSMAMERLKDLMETGMPQSFQLTFVHKSGRKIPTSISYDKLTKRPEWATDRMVADIQDITEIKAQQDYVNGLLGLLPIGMFTFDLETAQIFSANPLLLKLLDYKEEDLSQKTPLDLLPEELHKEAKALIQKTSETGEKNWIQWPMLKKDGTRLPVMISYGKVYDTCIKKDIMAVFVVDVSERERVKAKMELLFKLSPVAICEWRPGGELLSINEQFARMVGYSVDEVYKMGWKNLTAPEYQGDPDRLHEENALKGIDKTYQKEYIHKDGHRVPIYLVTEPVFKQDGTVDRYISYIQDITEIKKAEQAIEQERRYWRMLFDHAPLGVVVYGLDGRYKDVNDAFCDMAGMTKEELQDSAFHYRELFKEGFEEVMGLMKKVAETGKSAMGEALITGRHKKTPVLSTRVPLPWKDADGRPLLASFLQDVTLLKEAQEKLQELVETQQQTIKELSTPIIPVWSRVLMAPMMGSFDSMRMHDLSERLLEEVASKKQRAVLLDLSGLAYVDTQVISEVVRLITSVRILGTKTILSGITPHVVQSLVG